LEIILMRWNRTFKQAVLSTFSFYHNTTFTIHI
jgi:hypothetical protein